MRNSLFGQKPGTCDMDGPSYGRLTKRDFLTTLPLVWLCSHVILVSLLLGEAAKAAEISMLEVQHHEGRYSMHVNAFLNATPESVYQVLTDYDRFSRITEAIQETVCWINTNRIPRLFTAR